VIKSLLKTSTLLALSTVAISAHAGFVSTIDVSGDFALDGFSPVNDTDNNPFTYNARFNDVTGSAMIEVPPVGERGDVEVNGLFAADAGSKSILPPLFLENAIYPAESIGDSIQPGSFSYNFDTQEYTTRSGSFETALPTIPNVGMNGGPGLTIPSTLAVQYDILDGDDDGIVNDLYLSILETPSDPENSLSGLINFLDSLPTSGVPGSIDGVFALNVSANSADANNGSGSTDGDIDLGDSSGDMSAGEPSANVSESSAAVLFGLGLVGFAAGRRRTKRA